jgi:alanine racemase
VTDEQTAARERTWIEVDLSAVRENARTVLRRTSGSRLLPMIKADAYGLGAVAVARALEPLDPWGFGVATAAEGVALREAGIGHRILVVQPTMPELNACARHGLTPGLGSAAEVAAWRALAGAQPFHVQLDTGMHRGGVLWTAFAAEAEGFALAPGLEGVFTHFHSADEDLTTVREQWERLQGAVRALPRRPALVHAANSAAALRLPETAADLVRPGIFLYGGAVPGHTPRPVVTWRARASRAVWVEPGATVSYGATWRAAARTCVVSLAVGYADGFRRALSGRFAALLDGRRCPVLGRVTMDYTMVGTTGGAPPPDAVATLLGREGDSTITVEEMAREAGTISYEILTGIGPRVPRLYR